MPCLSWVEKPILSSKKKMIFKSIGKDGQIKWKSYKEVKSYLFSMVTYSSNTPVRKDIESITSKGSPYCLFHSLQKRPIPALTWAHSTLKWHIIWDKWLMTTSESNRSKDFIVSNASKTKILKKDRLSTPILRFSFFTYRDLWKATIKVITKRIKVRSSSIRYYLYNKGMVRNRRTIDWQVGWIIMAVSIEGIMWA